MSCGERVGNQANRKKVSQDTSNKRKPTMRGSTVPVGESCGRQKGWIRAARADPEVGRDSWRRWCEDWVPVEVVSRSVPIRVIEAAIASKRLMWVRKLRGGMSERQVTVAERCNVRTECNDTHDGIEGLQVRTAMQARVSGVRRRRSKPAQTGTQPRRTAVRRGPQVPAETEEESEQGIGVRARMGAAVKDAEAAFLRKQYG